jgi:hypothetical protein
VIDRGFWQRATATALGVLAGLVATAGTLAVAVAGFTLSYDAIRRVGIAAGVRADWAWLLPVSIDGAMAVATVTAVVLRRMDRAAWYPWAVVLAGSGISIACNAVHARMRDAIALDDRTAMAVSAIPALMLALSVHLLVVLVDAAARRMDVADSDRVAEAIDSTVMEKINSVDHAPNVVHIINEVPAPDLPKTRDIDTSSAPASEANSPVSSRSKPRTSGRPSGAEKVAKVAAKMPTPDPVKIAAKTGLSQRTVRRHLAALPADTSPDKTPDTGSANLPTPNATPVNGAPVPDLITASQGGTL